MGQKRPGPGAGRLASAHCTLAGRGGLRRGDPRARAPKTLGLYAHDLSLEPQQAKAWVCALAGLHDIGKASPAFQQKWLEGKERLWATGLTWSSDPTPPPDDLSHSIISEAVLPELLEARGWKYRAAQNVAAAVGEHHGFRATRGDLDKATTREKGNANWDEVRRELFEAVLGCWGWGRLPKLNSMGVRLSSAWRALPALPTGLARASTFTPSATIWPGITGRPRCGPRKSLMASAGFSAKP